jgi:uncharacterized protein involved in response to NO
MRRLRVASLMVFAPGPLSREPYRLFFPLGVAMAWAGVMPWLLLGSGITQEYLSIFHSLVQIQGFMTCFAVGFLFTFIPRFTRTRPPSVWALGIAAAAPLGIAVTAWNERWAVSQIFWLALLVDILSFAVRRARMKPRARQLPSRFVWVAAAFVLAAGGSVLTGIGGALGGDSMWIHDLGRGMVLQGMFAALVVGIGGLLLPTIAHGAPRPDTESPNSARGRWIHLLGALTFASSFLVEQLASSRLGFGLRAAVIAVALGVTPGSLRWPTRAGLHRRLVWLSVWMLPLSYASVAAFPEYRRIGLHIGFIGCFALLAFAVSLHVCFAHGGQPERLDRSPWPVYGLAAALAIALPCRLLVDLDPSHVSAWLFMAAAAFLGATILWGIAVAPMLTSATSVETAA